MRSMGKRGRVTEWRWLALWSALAVALIWSLPCLTDKGDCRETQAEAPDHVTDKLAIVCEEAACKIHMLDRRRSSRIRTADLGRPRRAFYRLAVRIHYPS